MHISNISLHEVIHSLRQSVAIIDSKGFIVSVNHAWIKRAREEGVPASFNWVGVNFIQIFDTVSTESEQQRRRFEAVFQGTGSYYSSEFRSIYHQMTKWFLIEASPLRQDGHGKAKGVVVCLSDISTSKKQEHDLMEALSQIRTLRGLLPMCAVCKRIRDDADIWNSIESFLEKHTHAEFTHDICPDCIRRLYPKYSSILDSPPCS